MMIALRADVYRLLTFRIHMVVIFDKFSQHEAIKGYQVDIFIQLRMSITTIYTSPRSIVKIAVNFMHVQA